MTEARLWAPWRLDYITSPKADGCIFCAQPAQGDDAGNYIVHRGERCFVMLNAFPYANGHVMVAPYSHVPSIEDLDDDEIVELQLLTRRSLGVVREAYGPEGFNIGINQGKVGGAGVEGHVHQHAVPRWGGDTNFMPVIADTRVLPQSLEASYAALREGFATVESRS
jgi:ATP adenylyltransferase